MRIAIASMPWSEHCRPSAALGSLAAYLRREEPGWEVVTRSEYVHVAADLRFDLYEPFAGDCYVLGELAYAVHLFPEREAAIRVAFSQRALRVIGEVPEAARAAGLASWEAVFDFVREVTGAHLTRTAEELAGDCDAVGLTCCFGQLFANLALTRQIKERDSGIHVILGGSTVSARVGPSVLEHFALVDYVIQGEGERPLLALLRLLEGDAAPTEMPRGVLGRLDGQAPSAAARLWEVQDMDDLPFPDFDEYAALAEELGLEWALPLEGSRGCWWDRTKKTGKATATCYFCNLNAQWLGYREKSVDRILEELRVLSDRYANPKVYFLDNIIRNRGVEDLARGIAALGRDFEIFYEMRANVRPHEILAMWEAGLSSTQFGIEAFSTSLLGKMGKGTRVIQNLEVMKTCQELGITNFGNLITHFPGATAEEVAETCRVVRRHAAAYEPTTLSRFGLGVDSTIDTLRERFGIANVRNKEELRAALPGDVWETLQLIDLDFDQVSEGVDWAPLQEARAEWVGLHRAAGEPLLGYRDGGTFLRVNDLRSGDQELYTFRGLEREIYLYCMETRKVPEVLARFAADATEHEIREHLEGFVEADLMFAEAGRVLSLAVAPSPRIAAARIRAARSVPLAAFQSEGPARPPVPQRLDAPQPWQTPARSLSLPVLPA